MKQMNVFLHACCGPCTIYPLNQLRQNGNKVTAYFYNPNIHPFKEFERRLNTLQTYADKLELPCIVEQKYGLTEYIREVAFHEADRCEICYHMRLLKTASLAKETGFDAFTTTLLYSKYQRHNRIISLCEKLSLQFNIPFFYQDYRKGWQEGIELSKELEMYRQPYCGCIYSEHERYDKSLRKK